MKVTKLTTYRLAPRWMFLKIETDEGISGWGEPVIEGRARRWKPQSRIVRVRDRQGSGRASMTSGRPCTAAVSTVVARS